MISYEEAGQLLGLAAARDQRTVGDADVLAWHSDLNAAGVSYADASAALTRFYAADMAGLEPEKRRRITTPDVISIARKIRNDRLANFTYEPPPGNSDPDYFRRLRGQLEATASGRVPPPRERPQLEGGPNAQMRALVASIGRAVADTDEEAAAETERNTVRRSGPLGRECPKCSAALGRPCRTPGGKERAPHPARKGEASSPEEERAEMDRRRAASAASLQRREEEIA